MATTLAPGASIPPQYKRSIKNYIVDSRFQLKYTGMIVGVSLAISGVLGTVLLTTSNAVINESTKVVEESKKVSDVVMMNMTKDPIYADNPELKAAFTAGAGEADSKIAAQSRALVETQKRMRYSLFGGLGLMVVLIGLLGIYYTHKVAGPIYKMKLLLGQVGRGKLNFQGRIRKGDELQDFFEAFESMVDKLKERQRIEVEQLEAAMEAAKSVGAGTDVIAKLEVVRDSMRKALDM